MQQRGVFVASKGLTKIVWLKGGFGNCLFQILPAIRELKKGRNVQVETFLICESIFTRAMKWKIHDKLILDFLKESYPSIVIKKRRFVEVVFPLLWFWVSSKVSRPFFGYYMSNHGSHTFNIESCTNFNGYFQNRLLLEEYKHEIVCLCDELRSWLNPATEYDTVVHIRLGDSVWAANLEPYYRRTLGELHAKRRSKQDSLVVTDSPSEFNMIYGEYKGFKVQRESLKTDFKAMMCCRMLYVAPSTLSWWAAHSGVQSVISAPSELIDILGFYSDDKSLSTL
jgi:hypothetical protein